jgi:hypothetical protein
VFSFHKKYTRERIDSAQPVLVRARKTVPVPIGVVAEVHPNTFGTRKHTAFHRNVLVLDPVLEYVGKQLKIQITLMGLEVNEIGATATGTGGSSTNAFS